MATTTPSTAKGRATRERIVRAAAELVAEHGVAAVSLDDVGALAPASRSQLYHYFDDKDALVRAVVDATSDAVLGAQDELIGQLDACAGIERWFGALVAVASAVGSDPGSSLPRPRMRVRPSRRWASQRPRPAAMAARACGSRSAS